MSRMMGNYHVRFLGEGARSNAASLPGGSVRVAVHRLRQRYRELLREAIADTVSGPEAVEEELRHLLQAVSV